ncbi:LysR family transcriptional regulator [Labrenzia sp. PHM005]|uniref:LysR family transcriptional regulator n=1 Tax=Labrenzia sp. PHM005 TaxID=2590016 RepID=UPI001140710F|nr:LysR family transcriptional regulator [Labrenzia sp. PHM005]QDG75435.1 LysR family transcriptional regulator [Labrenzia sp. PHM005]
MIDQLRAIAIFAKTVDHGSFRAAAQALNLSASVVSHHVSELEKQLGVALIYRSTRKLSLTPDGEQLLAAAHDMITAAETGLQAVSNIGQAPSGDLRVTIPATLAQSGLVDRIAAFSAVYPKVNLTLDFSDTRRELIGDGFDIAIRMGWLKDSSLISKKLYDVPRNLVASKKYLERKPSPKAPEQLEDWEWLILAPARSRKTEFKKTGSDPTTVRPKGHITVNDAHALYRLAYCGAGLAVVPDFLAEADLANGSMEWVLPDWSVEPVGVYAVWPPNVPKQGLSRLFVDKISGQLST